MRLITCVAMLGMILAGAAFGRSTATVQGTAGNDVLRGTAQHDRILGLGGNDRIFGHGNSRTHPDVLRGGAGRDHIDGGAGADHIFGGSGNDVISGRDNLTGGPIITQEHLAGGPGSDVVYGGPGRDRIQGGGDTEPGGGCFRGAITEEGFAGPDILYGDEGDDLVCGSNGNDRLFGGPGLDDLVGGRGNDTLVGGPGADHLDGGPGNDFIDNNDGQDTVECGPGIDRVVVEVYQETCELFLIDTNGPPFARDFTVRLRAGMSAFFGIFWEEPDEEDGDVASFAGNTAPAHGAVTCQPSSSPNSAVCTYTPAAGFVGSDGFEYTVRDRRGATGTGMVAIFVDP